MGLFFWIKNSRRADFSHLCHFFRENTTGYILSLCVSLICAWFNFSMREQQKCRNEQKRVQGIKLYKELSKHGRAYVCFLYSTLPVLQRGVQWNIGKRPVIIHGEFILRDIQTVRVYGESKTLLVLKPRPVSFESEVTNRTAHWILRVREREREWVRDSLSVILSVI